MPASMPLVVRLVAAVCALLGSEGLFELPARCTWEEAEHLIVLESLRPGADRETRQAGSEALARHGREHGWDPWGPELQPLEPGRCQAAALEALEQAAGAPGGGFIVGSVAHALERNGRSKDATRLLLAYRERTAAGARAAGFGRELGHIALRRGDYATALEHLERVTVGGRCGNCATSQRLRIDRARARCLVGLGRWDELVELVAKRCRPTGRGGMCFAEDLLEASRRRGDADPASVVREALALAPEEETAFLACVRHAEILRLPPVEASDHLLELLQRYGHHGDDVRAILRACPGAVPRWAYVLELDTPTRAESGLASMLAASGDPRLEQVLRERAPTSPRAGHRLERWERARSYRRAPAVPR